MFIVQRELSEAAKRKSIRLNILEKVKTLEKHKHRDFSVKLGATVWIVSNYFSEFLGQTAPGRGRK